MSILTTQPAAETVIIGCDSGNKLIKTRNTVTLAGIERLPAKPAVSPPDPLDIRLIHSLYYSISNTRLRYEPDKSINDNHLYLTLIAIAKELRARGMSPKNEIILAAGLPPGHMSSAKLAENYRNYFLRNGGMFRFQCGGVPHQINIKDVVVCPQAYSILLTLSPDVIKMPSVYVIDIGGGGDGRTGPGGGALRPVGAVRVEIDTDFLPSDPRIFGGIGYFIDAFECAILIAKPLCRRNVP